MLPERLEESLELIGIEMRWGATPNEQGVQLLTRCLRKDLSDLDFDRI